MLVLGFTNVYYTLWRVTKTIRYGAGEVVDGIFRGTCYPVTQYQYLQNLSLDYGEACDKIKELSWGEYEEDLNLRGDNGRRFERVGSPYKTLLPWQFSFGRLLTHDIRTSNDVWQLERAYKSEPNPRTRVYARRRLLELGELIKYTWYRYYKTQENPEEENPEKCIYRDVKERMSYCNKRQYEYLLKREKEKEISGHFFEEGQRVNLNLKKIGSFSFETNFGITWVESLLSDDGKLFKYMGGTPPKVSDKEFTPLVATVKHSVFKEVKETRLQRIKIL